ncbi:MAG: DUF4112 domain-containing protein, partial [Pseudomonadota bacterium]
REPRTMSMTQNTSTDYTARLARLERLAHNLDSRYRVPGTRIRFGWDALLGLIPGLGDVASLGPAGYVLLEGHRMGAPVPLKVKMLGNIAVDWVVGSIPIVGDLLDVGLKANRRNVALLKSHFQDMTVPQAERDVDMASVRT